MGQEQSVVNDGPPVTLSERSLDAVADYIKSGKVRRIVVMTGAGISTAAGIPDFRSPETGLYANLAKLNLPEPEAVFDLNFFKTNPKPFYVLAKDLYPGNFHPTISHVFIRMLSTKGLLHQLYTQNIDCLERAAGIPSELIVEAHGSFANQRCIDCKTAFPHDLMREHISRAEVPRCTRPNCKGLVKPDIVFFHEALPSLFYDRIHMADTADLALVMGTSLQVHPFASLPEQVPTHVPRVLFNLERVGSLGSHADDVLVLGDCDTGVRKLADALGWREELEAEWRQLVGHKEAKKQLQGATKRDAELYDEVTRLADEVDEVLHLQDQEEAGRKAPSEEAEQHTEGTAEQQPGNSTEDTHTPIESKAPAPELSPQPTGTARDSRPETPEASALASETSDTQQDIKKATSEPPAHPVARVSPEYSPGFGLPGDGNKWKY
ncbi:DHS-like NAD/FAD-binding domain-containing protein [Cercophora scortea]|uniref:DHS-like NAD/FAD-binding domain-containing protein n=1 Tax=Cercophora scortea TaxID=314031 RepID=A0AAE0J3R7_9PEZI|nr:DHS-like NAD/FAD-binding domain-containing protein [Cercophora scortea]